MSDQQITHFAIAIALIIAGVVALAEAFREYNALDEVAEESWRHKAQRYGCAFGGVTGIGAAIATLYAPLPLLG